MRFSCIEEFFAAIKMVKLFPFCLFLYFVRAQVEWSGMPQCRGRTNEIDRSIVDAKSRADFMRENI